VPSEVIEEIAAGEGFTDGRAVSMAA